MTSTDVMKLNACARGDISLAQARDVSPEALAAGRALAAFLAQAGRPRVAARILAGLVALDPADAWSWRSLAALHLDRGDAPSAGHAAERAAQLAQRAGHTDHVAALLVARALLAQGQSAAASPWLEAAGSRGAPGHVARLAGALSRHARRPGPRSA